jgi:phage terminase large subunit
MSAAAAIPFDWQRPDYLPVIRHRVESLQRIRQNPGLLPTMRQYYADHPATFIADWGSTLDPRHVERGLPSFIPFVLFPKQIECVDWIVARWRAGEPGLIEKSRDSGLSWLTVALACTLCLFHKGMVIGCGSRKLDYADQIGSPKSMLEKARLFMSSLPPEFVGGWTREKHAPYCRILFPESGSIITAEGGDGIGRGDRTSIYFVDESAYLERSALVDASLSATTNCRIDVSTPNGMANSFAQRRHSGRFKVFTFSWMSDPRKGRAWYEKQCTELDSVTLAQEVDCNYSASVEGVVIPSAWVSAAIDLHVRLGIKPTGIRLVALDVADRGMDKNAFCVRHGFLLEHVQSWSGSGSDIFATTEKAFHLCDSFKLRELIYDGDGLGAGVRGDARKINERRRTANSKTVNVNQFRGSGTVLYPDQLVPRPEAGHG